MHQFRVWAPHPQRVDLVLGERRVAMTPSGEGWSPNVSYP
jgi:1,4-alpha-glucan branching enzyme